MNGVLWFLAPYLLVVIPLLIIVAVVVAIRMDWGRARG